jgi:hypothetical protein
MVNNPVLQSVLLKLVSDDEKCKYASTNDYLSLPMRFHENRCPWDDETCECASEHDHLECPKYAHENGCARDEAARMTSKIFTPIKLLQLQDSKFANLHELYNVDNKCIIRAVQMYNDIHDDEW